MKLQVATLVKMVESVIVGSPSYKAWSEATVCGLRTQARKIAMQKFRLPLVEFLMDTMDENADKDGTESVRFHHHIYGGERESNATIASAFVNAYSHESNYKRGCPNPEFVHCMVEATFWLIEKDSMIQAFRSVVTQGVNLPNFFLAVKI